MYFVFRLVYNTSVPSSRYVVWFPLGNLVIDGILLRAIRMCLTGQVNWRGTEYGAAPCARAGGSEPEHRRPESEVETMIRETTMSTIATTARR